MTAPAWLDAMPATPSDLRALLAAATPGPWKAGRNGPIAMVVSGYDPDRFPRQFRADCGISDADATLIAAAVNALGPLLDALDAAEAERDAARAELAATQAVLNDGCVRVEKALAEARRHLQVFVDVWPEHPRAATVAEAEAWLARVAP